MLRFDGKVAVITGAGGGLGRAYALLFAERGASVVVNDLGGTATGDGKSTQAADTVVNEIRNKGGKAIANYDSVENGDKIIKTAIDNFGRVDIIVNNAGILRDKSFKNMTEQDWDLVNRIHLKGAFNVTKAAWQHMCNQKYGRIIMTSSNSGIYGNFGQANYSAAKSGLVGLSHTLSREGAKYNVFCNAIVPTAGSRMTQNIVPPEVFETLKPEYVAPLVVWLCHDSCPETGGLYEAAAGWYGKLQYYRSHGGNLRDSSGRVTPEDVRNNWNHVTDMKAARHFESMESVTADLMESIANKQQQNPADPNKVYTAEDIQERSRHTRIDPAEYEYTQKDAILYAYSIGATVEKNLNLLYEGHENFTVFPSFAVVPDFRVMSKLLELRISRIKLDPVRMLHGEQYFEFKKPIPPSGKLISHFKLADIMDKGKDAVALLHTDLRNEQNESLVFSQYSVYFRGSGGFKGYRDSKEDRKILPVPKRKPDYIVEEKTSPNQPALYRQATGDYNPVHIDPDFAKAAGFDKPIMHGLCSLGFSMRHLIEKYSPNDFWNLRTLKVRFSSPVFPGQTLVTEMWKGDNNRIHFQTKVKETGKVAISGGYADFHSLGARAPAVSSKIETPPEAVTPKAQIILKSTAVFDEIKRRLSSDSDIAKQIQAIFLWVITKAGVEAKKYTIDLKTGSGSVYDGEPKNSKADVTLTIGDDDMVSLVTGALNPQQAFLTGKLKLKGNIMLTQKLQKLFQEKSKL